MTANQLDRRHFLKLAACGAAAAALPVSCGGPTPEEIWAGTNPADMAAAKDFSPAQGIVPPLITPFNENRSIDWDALERLIEWHIGKGVTGVFIVCGSGEYYRLTEDEAVELAAFTVRVAAGRVHVLAGSTNREGEGTDGSPEAKLRQNVAMTRRVEETGVGGCFITPPRSAPWLTLLTPGMDQFMLDYLLAIHEATTCQLYAYEKPDAAFGYRFSPQVVAELAKRPRYVAMKDTSTRRGRSPEDALEPVRDKLQWARGALAVMQANTRWLLESFRMGCTGGINTTANVAPGLFAAMYERWRTGDNEAAEELQQRINRVDRMLRRGYMMSAKVALGMMGVPVKPVCRIGSREFDAEGRARLEEMVALIRETEQEFGIPVG